MPQSPNGASRSLVTPETLGRELKDALPIKRILSLSIHDRDGDAVWMSEDQLGPDEHNVVLEAITVFEVEGNRAYVSEDLGDGRSAAFFASCSPHGELVGVAMVIADKRSIDTLGAAKLVTPKVRSVMQRLAIVMKPGSVIPGRKGGKPAAKGGYGKNPFAIAEPDELEDAEDFGSASDIFSPPELPIDPAVLARQPRRNGPMNGQSAPKIPEARPGERVAARATIRSDAPSVLRQSDPAAQIAGIELAAPARAPNTPARAPARQAPAAPQAAAPRAAAPTPAPAPAATPRSTPTNGAPPARMTTGDTGRIAMGDTGRIATGSTGRFAVGNTGRMQAPSAPSAPAAAQPRSPVPARVAPPVPATHSIEATGSIRSDQTSRTGRLRRPEVEEAFPTPPPADDLFEQILSKDPTGSFDMRGRNPAATGTHGVLESRQATGETSRMSAAPVSQAMIADISLHVQQLMKLRSGGRTRRYEVLVRGRHDASGDAMSEELVKALSLRESAAAIDRTVVTELAGWLKQHPHVWNSDPASFSINLSTGSLLDPSFVRFVAQTLQTTGVAPDTIGFEVPEQAFFKHRDACTAFFDACEKIGCYVIIDDFTMHSDVVPFLASRALRVVKIDPRLTHSAMRDRLAQALVIAISQASKVLGLHCVAKRIDSAGTRQWLSAVGIDFAQGFVLEDPQPLEALATPVAQRPSAKQSTTRPI